MEPEEEVEAEEDKEEEASEEEEEEEIRSESLRQSMLVTSLDKVHRMMAPNRNSLGGSIPNRMEI